MPNWEGIAFVMKGANYRITTERLHDRGNTFIYRDIIEVYEDLTWKVLDIKYVVFKEND